MITADSILLPQPFVASRVLDGEAVLVHPIDGKIKVLNEVGAFIWSQLDGSRNVRQVAALVCQQFDVDAETAEADVIRFIESLLARDLVRIGNPDPG